MYVLHENSNQFCDEYKVDWKKKERKERYNPILRRGEKHNSCGGSRLFNALEKQRGKR